MQISTVNFTPQRAHVFLLRGSLQRPDGSPLSGFRVAIVDRDEDSEDDLLGVGFTDEEGAFRLSFTRTEFNQEPDEREATPDLYAVISTFSVFCYRAIAIHDITTASFDDEGTLNLDPIIVTPHPDGFLKGIDTTPGYPKPITRLDIDNALVEHCLKEVCPLIESLTGWSGLLNDLTVEIVPNLDERWHQLVDEIEQDRDAVPKDTVQHVIKHATGMTAAYDPFDDTLLINATWLENYNLDALKVIIGHELVHVGQYRHTPGLLAQHRAYATLISRLKRSLSEVARLEASRRIQQSPWQRYLKQIEGYATHIQQDHLERHYNLATFFPTPSPIVQLFDDALKRLCPQEAQFREARKAHYEEGLEQVRKLAAAQDGPLRFELPQMGCLESFWFATGTLLDNGDTPGALASAEEALAALKQSTHDQERLSSVELGAMEDLAQRFNAKGRTQIARRILAICQQHRDPEKTTDLPQERLRLEDAETLSKERRFDEAAEAFCAYLQGRTHKRAVPSFEAIKLISRASHHAEQAHRWAPALQMRLDLLRALPASHVEAREQRKHAAIVLEKMAHPTGAEALRSGCSPDEIPPRPAPTPLTEERAPARSPSPNASRSLQDRALRQPTTDGATTPRRPSPLQRPDSAQVRASLRKARASISLAHQVMALKNFDKARDILKRALQVQEEHLKTDAHPDTIATLVALNEIAQTQSTQSQRFDLLQRLLNAQTQYCGPTHADTLNTIQKLAALMVEREDFRAARVMYARIMHHQRDTLGEGHPHTTRTTTQVINMLEQLEEFDDAIKLQLKLVQTFQAQFKDGQHPSVAYAVQRLEKLQEARLKTIHSTVTISFD